VKDRDRWIRFDPPRLATRQGREGADFKHDLDLLVIWFVANGGTHIAM
jgi:hypothetical protein